MKVPAPYEAIIRSARAQYGLVTREQVLEAGHSPAQLEHLVRSRRWERIHRSVYRVSGVPETHEQRIFEPLLAAGVDLPVPQFEVLVDANGSASTSPGPTRSSTSRSTGSTPTACTATLSRVC